MKKKIAMKWCEALESGEYKQARGQLRKSGRFCCLGVLCNMHAQAHPDIAAEQKRATEYMGEQDLPPMAVQEWAGLGTEEGAFYGYAGLQDTYTSLADLNDDVKLTFPEIAKVIRKHYKEL